MKDLSEIDIARICISSPFLNKFFGGVYPRSFYPDSQKIGSNKFYIYNNQMEDSAGMHWIMIFYMKDKTIFWDSFGFGESFWGYWDIVENKGLPLTRNVRQIQDFLNPTCGHHAIFVAYCLAKGLKLNVITEKIYSRDTIYNDQLVFNFVKKLAWKHQKIIIM